MTSRTPYALPSICIPGRLLLGAVLALVALVPLAGCGKNGLFALLSPTGEKRTGIVVGRVVLSPPDSIQKTLVLLARLRDTTCVSQFTIIQMVGDNTSPAFDVATAPDLLELAPCFWIDTLTILSSRFSGELRWKFVTEGTFDSPPDYTTSNTGQTDGIDNTLTGGGAGSPNLRAIFPPDMLNQPIVCTVDETSSPARYRFAKLGEGPATLTSALDGSFRIERLAKGTYLMRILPPSGGMVDLRVEVGDDLLNLGTVRFGGRIEGRLAFDPNTFPDLVNPPYPPTTLTLLQNDVVVATQVSSRMDTVWSFEGLDPGNYKVRADARMFSAESTTVMVSSGTAPIVRFSLKANFSELASNMHVIGDFNNRTIADSTQMSLMAPIVWVYTPSHPITAGTYKLRFVTDGSLDNPTDYGGDSTQVVTAPLTFAPTGLVSGPATDIKVQLPATGNYKFTLDERRQTYSVESVPAPRLSAGR